MIKKRVKLLVCSICMMLSLLSCSRSQSENTNEAIDINATHIKMELMEKICVDADITPYDKYKNGVSSYYTESYVDVPEAFDYQSLKENAKMFKQDIFAVLESIEDNMDGSFNLESLKIIDEENSGLYGLTILHKDTEGIERMFSYVWSIKENGIGSPEVGFESSTEEDASVVEACGMEADRMEHFLGADIENFVFEAIGKDASFATADDIGAQYKVVLESIMGEQLSDAYKIVPVTQSYVDTIAERSGYYDSDIVLDEEFYRCIYYRAIDGLPVRLLMCDLTGERSGTLSEDITGQVVSDNYLLARDEWPLVVDVDKNGIRALELTAIMDIGDVYKEKQQVLDINEMLDKIKEYFTLSYQIYDIDIYNIELCYGGYFSDEEDGPIRNIMHPFWIVDYHMEGAEPGIDTNRLIFDAYTGEFMRTNDVM